MSNNYIIVPESFKDVEQILKYGVKKGYDANGWMVGDRFSKDKNTASMMRHLVKYGFMDRQLDTESGKSHLLHLACRALMQYHMDTILL